MTNPENNPIGYIQELCQKYHLRFPEYEDIKVSGPDHSREFTCKCTFEGLETIGQSRQKKQAKSEAAKAMVALMRESSFLDKFEYDLRKSINHENLSGNDVGLTNSYSKNPISAINEYCQQKSFPPPKYVETSIGNGVFLCECVVKEKKVFGQGSNKKSAKTEAALKMCLELEINCNGIGCMMEELSAKEDSIFEKNPVSLLQEMCAQNHSLKQLQYNELPNVLNYFVVKCSVNSISCEGRGTTKKIAKAEAAKKVLEKLQNINETSNESVLNTRKAPALPTSEPRVTSTLEDFAISDDEDDNKNNEKQKISDVDLSLQLESLNITNNDVCGGESKENQAKEEPQKE